MTKTIENVQSEINDAIDARISFENVKSNNENQNIVKTLNNVRKDLSHADIAKVLLASNYDASAINRAERVNARRNVYSIEKDANIARAIAKVETLNHYTLAILRAAIALEAIEVKLTHKDAASACSLSIKTNDAARENVLRAVKYQRNVAANTASTQSSSSINALQALNVLIEERNEANEICYSLNRKSHAAKKLIAALS